MSPRPAAKDALDAEMQQVGVPAHVPSGDPASGGRFFIVELALASDDVGSGSPDRCSCCSPAAVPQSAHVDAARACMSLWQDDNPEWVQTPS